jgi:MoaA/NifB/PqqE/SkfB family radical SAM enzyme
LFKTHGRLKAINGDVNMNSILSKIESCSLFTGTFGRKGCTGNCIGCYIDKHLESYPSYQGNIAQVHELMEALPSLKQVYIFGNPDPSVDSEFCNASAKILQAKGIETLFVSNGVGGIDVIKKVIDELDLTLVRGFGISIDSLNEKGNSAMRGVKVSLEDVFKSIKYLRNLDIDVKIFTTIWPMNADENWKEFIDYFESRGIFTVLRFGHAEAVQGRVNHVCEEKIIEIRNNFSNIRLATLLANDEEYADYLSTHVAQKDFRCTNFENISVYFTGLGIKATYACPIISHVYPKYFVDLCDLGLHEFYDELTTTGICPAAKHALGFESESLHSVCRFYKKHPKNKKLTPSKSASSL